VVPKLSAHDLIAWLCIPGLCLGLIGTPLAAAFYLGLYYAWLAFSALTRKPEVRAPTQSALWLALGPVITLASGSARFLIRVVALVSLNAPGWGTR
jgi:hypothetical protein